MALIGAQPVEYIELGQSKFRFRILARHFRKQLLFAPFERHIDVAKHAQQPVCLVFRRLARNAGERPVIGDLGKHELGVAFAHGLGESQDQLAGRTIGKVYALEVDDDVAGGFAELGAAP
jgi:hypothetical protein